MLSLTACLLRNEHIVQYIGTERTEENLNIFLEYIAGGSIASLIDKFGALQVEMCSRRQR